jgi:hypothetical protein
MHRECEISTAKKISRKKKNMHSFFQNSTMEKAAQDPPVNNTQMDSTSSATAAAIMNNNNDDEGAINESSMNNSIDGLGGGGSGSDGIRPVFLGNLSHGALSSDIEHLFRNPVSRRNYGEEKEEGMASEIAPFLLDRVVS